MLKIICLNGAPGTGKDTTGSILKKKYHRSKILKISEPLDVVAMNLLDATKGEYKVLREEHKNRILEEFGMTISLRQLLINISEDLVKPSMGKVWLAWQLHDKIQSLRQMFGVFIITSVGFQYEFDELKTLFDGIAQVRLINLQREGHTYDGDSREDVSDGEDTIVIHNDEGLEELKSMLGLEMFDV